MHVGKVAAIVRGQFVLCYGCPNQSTVAGQHAAGDDMLPKSLPAICQIDTRNLLERLEHSHALNQKHHLMAMRVSRKPVKMTSLEAKIAAIDRAESQRSSCTRATMSCPFLSTILRKCCMHCSALLAEMHMLVGSEPMWQATISRKFDETCVPYSRCVTILMELMST